MARNMSDSKADAGRGEHLSTVGERDPLKVLAKLGAGPLVIVVVAVEPEHAATGRLEEKGAWVKSLWRLTLSTIPEAEGCRLSWNTLFFAVPGQSAESVVARFQELLTASRQPGLESLCLLFESVGTPAGRMAELDEMLDEVSARRNFGSNPRFRHRILDGAAWRRQ